MENDTAVDKTAETQDLYKTNTSYKDNTFLYFINFLYFYVIFLCNIKNLRKKMGFPLFSFEGFIFYR